MNTKALLAGILLSTSVSFAGVDSGGGAGIFCPASITNQPSVQLLDLYEGRINYELEIPETNVPYEEQIEQALNKLSFDFSLKADMRKTLVALKANHKFLPVGVGIYVPPDLGEGEAVVMPTGCTLGAIGYYETNGTLKISNDAFSALSETQKAAFWMHEAFYSLDRYYYIKSEKFMSVPNSKATRQFISQLFSQSATQEKLFKMSESGTWRKMTETIMSHGVESISPVPGKESWFSYSGGITPINLLGTGGRIEVQLSADRYLGAPNYAKIVCAELDQNHIDSHLAIKTKFNLAKPVFLDENYLLGYSGEVTQNCKILRVYVEWGNFISGEKLGFKILYNGAEIMSGKTDGRYHLLFYMPIYYQQ
ncbi:MAG: hypothetical protein V4654_00495 [Bdellovibrionota bacterium]